MKGKNRLIIFDFDGTLVNTLPHIVSCMAKCVEKFNLRKISDGDVERFNGAVLANVLRELGAKDSQLLEIRDYYRKIFFEDISDITLIDGVYNVLTKLKENEFTLTIATNRSRETMIPLLEALKILPFFDIMVCSGDVENKKPSADMVELILKELNFKKDDVLVVGDTKFDVEMGNNAGCKTCLYCESGEVGEVVASLSPSYVIKKFDELLEILK